MSRLDTLLETSARKLARKTSRRGFFARLGIVATGVAAAPLLPVYRQQAMADKANPEDPGDPQSCDYWRYCAIDGFLCSCCGGTKSSCPPGTILSPITWVGTCRNPGDGKDYIISYNDCCGQTACGRCTCMRDEGDRPVYDPANSNNINWCSGSDRDMVYNCSTAIIVGVADD